MVNELFNLIDFSSTFIAVYQELQMLRPSNSGHMFPLYVGIFGGKFGLFSNQFSSQRKATKKLPKKKTLKFILGTKEENRTMD